VPLGEIDRWYFDRPYYIVLDGKAGEEALAVIRAMKDKERVALARIVLTNREHVMAILPFGKIMLGTILRYDYEVHDEKVLARWVPTPRIPKEMVKLASHILDTKASRFDPSKFKDAFESELRKLIKRKAAGKTIETPAREEQPSDGGASPECQRQASRRAQVIILDKKIETSIATSG
jgi:DNA end-binding protein Ku